MSRFVLRTIILGLWIAFFLWLLISGEVQLYIGPRTRWVPFFGVIALGVVTVLRLIDRPAEGTMTTTSEKFGTLALLLPMLVILSVPNPSLGALAVAKKSSGGIVGAVAQTRKPVPRDPNQPISLQEIGYAAESLEYAQAVGITPGSPVKLVGFVTHPKKQTWGDFTLARFSIFCCAADAVPSTVAVSSSSGGGSELKEDTWLRIEGTIVETPSGLGVEAREISEIPAPKNPYIL